MYIVNNVGIYQIVINGKYEFMALSLHDGLDLFKSVVEAEDDSVLVELITRRPNKDGSFSREICRRRKPSNAFRSKWATRTDESGCVYTYCRHCSAEGGCGC